MEAHFWHKKWETNEIGFHANEANPLLVKHFNQLSLKKASRVFLPLCGKTLDIPWLLENDYKIAGAELSKLAIEQLFITLGIEPKINPLGNLLHYSAANIDIFVGDIFDLTSETLGPVDAIYDRAALVALPTTMRNQYTTHLLQITAKAPQLLICYDYDQSLQEGPPFSICDQEVNQHYADSYNLILLGSKNLDDGLKGKCAALEKVWLLKTK
jgi:thiopurine S-methyltransferase